MLKKMVDGKEILLSEEEERQQRAYWDLNDKYPEYSGHCGWDGVNEPFHDMQQCRKRQKLMIQKAYERAKADLTSKIEISQEESNEPMIKSLLAQRKSLREDLELDLSSCKTVDDLRARTSEALKPYMEIITKSFKVYT